MRTTHYFRGGEGLTRYCWHRWLAGAEEKERVLFELGQAGLLAARRWLLETEGKTFEIGANGCYGQRNSMTLEISARARSAAAVNFLQRLSVASA
jgi:hypothetical protein